MSGPKIKFVDFYPGFSPTDNFLYEVLREHFDVVLSDDPDFLFFSIFGFSHHFKYRDVVKILWTGENVRPNFKTCDYALSFDYSSDPRNLRWPLCAYYTRCCWVDASKLSNRGDLDTAAVLAGKRRFCNFVYSNPNAKERIAFFELLSKYKRVDSAGSVFNNMGGKVVGARAKLSLLAESKFTIAIENSSHPGYVTEKIVDPLLAHSVPIYWGSERVGEDFDEHSFVNCHRFATMQEAVDRVVELDRDDALYARCLKAPCFPNDVQPACFGRDYVVPFFRKIFSEGRPRTMSAEELVATPGGWSGMG